MDQTLPAIELAHSDLPPALRNLLSDDNRVHVVAGESATKIGNHQVLAIELVQPPAKVDIIGPALLIHLSASDSAGVSALKELVPLRNQATSHLKAIGISIDSISTDQRALVVTTAKLPTSKDSSLIHLRNSELRNEFQLRTIYTEVATIAAMQQMASFSLRNLVPADRDDRKAISKFLDQAIVIRNSLWWRTLSSNKISAELLQDIREYLKTDLQMEELLEHARDLRQSEELRATNNFNLYGLLFAISAISAAWIPLVTNSTQSSVWGIAGLGLTAISLAALFIWRNIRKNK